MKKRNKKMESIKEYLHSKKEFTHHVPFKEDISVPIKVGDTVLGGKFKNRKIVVEDIGKNEKGDITINGSPLLRFRILDKQPEEEE